jgi:hypothetical protein
VVEAEVPKELNGRLAVAVHAAKKELLNVYVVFAAPLHGVEVILCEARRRPPFQQIAARKAVSIAHHLFRL